MLEEVYGGEGGIRTPGARKGSLAFEASAIDHSATSPQLVGHLSKERWGPKAAIHGEKRRHSWNHVPRFAAWDTPQNCGRGYDANAHPKSTGVDAAVAIPPSH